MIEYLKRLKGLSERQFVVQQFDLFDYMKHMIELAHIHVINSYGELQSYKQKRLDDYRSAELGLVDNRPSIHNLTQLADYIARPAQTERRRAITRRVRSH